MTEAPGADEQGRGRANPSDSVVRDAKGPDVDAREGLVCRADDIGTLACRIADDRRPADLPEGGPVAGPLRRPRFDRRQANDSHRAGGRHDRKQYRANSLTRRERPHLDDRGLRRRRDVREFGEVPLDTPDAHESRRCVIDDERAKAVGVLGQHEDSIVSKPGDRRNAELSQPDASVRTHAPDVEELEARRVAAKRDPCER